jgi:hypothetical protein
MDVFVEMKEFQNANGYLSNWDNTRSSKITLFNGGFLNNYLIAL